MKHLVIALFAITLFMPAAKVFASRSGSASVRTDVTQTNAMIQALNTVVSNHGHSGTGDDLNAIVPLGGILVSRLQNLQADFDAVVADATLTNEEKIIFLQQAYLDINSIQAQVSGLITLMNALYGSAAVNSIATNLRTVVLGIIQSYNVSSGNYDMVQVSSGNYDM